MSNSLTARLSIREIRMPLDTATAVRSWYIRQAKTSCFTALAIFAFVGFGLAGIGRAFFWPDRSPVLSLVIGLSCGMLAGLGVLIASFIDWLSVRKELVSSECVEIEVVACQAIRICFKNSDLPGIALNCGEKSVVLIGSDWMSRIQPNLEFCFPTSHFSLRYLPGSGKVLSVKVSGKKLQLEADDPRKEPVLKIDIAKSTEIAVVSEPLNALIVEQEARSYPD